MEGAANDRVGCLHRGGRGSGQRGHGVSVDMRHELEPGFLKLMDFEMLSFGSSLHRMHKNVRLYPCLCVVCIGPGIDVALLSALGIPTVNSYCKHVQV